jgi:hypothetical protein
MQVNQTHVLLRLLVAFHSRLVSQPSFGVCRLKPVGGDVVAPGMWWRRCLAVVFLRPSSARAPSEQFSVPLLGVSFEHHQTDHQHDQQYRNEPDQSVHRTSERLARVCTTHKKSDNFTASQITRILLNLQFHYRFHNNLPYP